MKADLTTLGAFQQSQSLGKKNPSLKDGAKVIDPNLLKNPNPDYKLELTSRAPAAPSIPSVPTPSLPSLPSVDLPKANPVKEAIKDEVKEKATKEVKEVKKVEEKAGSVKRPAIFFIKGLDIFFSPSKSESGYAGVGKIAEAIEGSRMYGWRQKDEMMKEIKKVHADQPVILVGHSLGGDTAVEIANELDTLENKFRPVDLLITMDAVGFNNDVIPQNVKKHLNIFGEKNFFLNDGPHVARREEMTQVRNILSPLEHTDLDDDKELQFEMVKLIQETLKRTV